MSEEQNQKPSINPLFAAFTEDERSAVAQLKNKLDGILTLAVAPEDYSLWGIPLDKESSDERLEVLLIKFLRARNLDVAEAQVMLTNTIKWRLEFKVDGILEEKFDEAIFPGRIGFIHGLDIKNRPVTYNLYGGLDNQKVFGDVEKFLRWRVQLMERGIEELDFVNVDQMIQVHDYEGIGLGSHDKTTKTASKKVTQVMQDNYPEFLAVKFFVNVPWWGDLVFKFISVFLAEQTKKKFVVTSASNVKEHMTKYITEEELPTKYGGIGVVPELEIATFNGGAEVDDGAKESTH
ncbi:423_t:CDS:2 [Ambispora gerdemannii]|uniref:423_t:CDS:1 n=1 Tax=Ambispora gerdemannii TaxID=144530 RepID=A0A9N9CEE0_9GLOM|nr:423_t:CDS:2 [Ambispora gerdemannii]